MADSLTIEKATYGYDSEGMKEAINQIQVNLIDESVEQLQNSCEQKVLDEVDTFWVGASADAFKKAIQENTEDVVKKLSKIKDDLQTELNSVGKSMVNADKDLASQIKSN